MKRRAWSFARRALIKLSGDPTCSLPMHGRDLNLPLSHALPDYLEHFPLYDRLPRRLSEYVHRAEGRLVCIDVGANIGDTIASFYGDESDAFLAIEPNPKFGELLAANWGWNEKVAIVSEICSSGSDEGTYLIQERHGTASIHRTEEGERMRRRPLDEIVKDHPFAEEANVLKVDTDGHDFEVIEGAKNLLSRRLPAVMFECDAFENADYVEACLRALELFRGVGYNHFLVYDNFGSLMGRYALGDTTAFRNLLFFQLTSNFYYFDILVMKDEDLFPFHAAEVEFFVGKVPSEALKRAAVAAAGLPAS
jgi:FkbM family methyltransferase